MTPDPNPRPLSSRTRGQRGQAAVEIALLLPMLLILLFGIIISGSTFYAFIQVSNAAREGARAGSLYRITQYSSGLTLDETVEQAIYDPGSGASALGFLVPTSPSFDVVNDVDVTLVDMNGILSPGDQVNVAVTYRYTFPILSGLLPMFPQPIVIVRSVSMEVQ